MVGALAQLAHLQGRAWPYPGGLVFLGIWVLCWTAPAIACGQPAAAPTSSSISFERTIAPLLTRYGCNAAACHGASGGRGGFALSLFGSRPREDFDAIVQQEQGRRLHWETPENSLLLAKATASIDHEGGMRFEIDSEPWERIRDWVQSGALYGSPLGIQRLEISPTQLQASVNQTIPFQVWAYDAVGQRFDVTDDAWLETEDDATLRLNSHATAVPLRSGNHRLLARYAGQVAVATITVPFLSDPDTAATLSPPRSNTPLDHSLVQAMQQLGLAPAAAAPDHVIFRRLALDLAGRGPSWEEWSEIVQDQRPDRFHRWIDRRLASIEFDEIWTYRYARWFGGEFAGDPTAISVHRFWIKESIHQDSPWAETLTRSLVSRGDSHHNGALGFYRTSNDPRLLAERFALNALGSRLRCANCHDHPLDRWTQDDYHGLAGVFAQVSTNRQVEDLPSGFVMHPASGTRAIPKLPGPPLADPVAPSQVSTDSLSQWLQQEAAARVDQVHVNRIWSSLMGRGFVEPIDDWRATNPPTHPQTFEWLSDRYQHHHRSLRWLVREIVRSDAYQRSSSGISPHEIAAVWHDHVAPRALSPEILLDQLTLATEVPELDSQGARIERAIHLPSRNLTSSSLSALGRCPSGPDCSSESPIAGSMDLREGLHWINGPLITTRLEHPQGWLQRSFAATENAEQWLTHFLDRWYVRSLGRVPSDAERQIWSQSIAACESEPERQQCLQDLVWATLAMKEFRERP